MGFSEKIRQNIKLESAFTGTFRLKAVSFKHIVENPVYDNHLLLKNESRNARKGVG